MSTQVVIVEFKKMGGLAGLQEQMLISNNGHGILSGTPNADPNGFDLDADSMSNLKKVLSEAGFDQFAGQTFPCEGRDMIEYTVTYNGDTVAMCEDRVPEQLRAAVDLLNQIALEHGGE